MTVVVCFYNRRELQHLVVGEAISANRKDTLRMRLFIILALWGTVGCLEVSDSPFFGDWVLPINKADAWKAFC